MPTARTYRRRYYQALGLVPVKRTRKRRTRRHKTGYKVPRSVGSYRGEYRIAKLRYTFNDGAGHALDSTSGALSTDYVYRANGMYDPYAGAGGGQPRGFDQYMAMFRQFCVLGSKIHLFLGYGLASSTSSDMQVAIVLKDGSSAIANAEDLMESPRLRTKLMTAGRDSTVLNHYFSFRMTGSKDALDNDDLWGTSSADPDEQWYYHVLAFQPGGGTESLRFTGWIEYTAVFFHAIQPTAS